MDSFRVRSSQHDYPVYFNKNIQELFYPIQNLTNTKFLIDENVFRLHESSVKMLVQNNDYINIQATEENKTLNGVEKVCTWLQECGANSSTHLIVLGGGITQDIGTFAAATYYRGIKWSLIPTTLLSMADSCLGAKCAVNLNQFKNQIGLFWSPQNIWICSEFLKTLSPIDIMSGHGEIYKLSMVFNTQDRINYENDIKENGFINCDIIRHISNSLKNKTKVIEEDEFDQGNRRWLNYGHTFGHALESLTLNKVPHGVAVTFGIDLMNYYSMKKGILNQTDFINIHEFIKNNFKFELLSKISGLDLIRHAKKDKKVVSNKAKFAIYTSKGNIKIKEEKLDEDLEVIINDYLIEFGNNLISNGYKTDRTISC